LEGSLLSADAAAHLSPLLVERQLDPDFAPALNNVHATYAPHRVYSCQCDDVWSSLL
jgi:hypothetical protein